MEFNSSNLMELMHLLQSIDCKTTYEKLQEVVLFIGKTGDGKSTLTEFLAENPNLMSDGSHGEYVIVDRTSKRIGDAETTILSQTSYPFPVWPRSSKRICYLDCPGFQDTRNSSADICCTICTKKALMRCRSVKIILVISYEEVKKGGQRNGFLDLVKHATEFIKVPDNFKNSIALIVTKVPNSTEKVNGKPEYVLVADEVIKERIANFLQAVKTTILGIQDVPEEKQALYENAIKLIKILMSDGRSTTRIGVFRCPDEAGSIQKIDLLQNCKNALNTIIEDVLEFTVPGQDDFGYTISAETKDCITKGVNQIVWEIEPILRRILQKIESTYEAFENETQGIQDLSNQFAEQYCLWEDANQKLLHSTITSDALSYLLDHMEKLFSSKFFASKSSNTGVSKQEVDDLHPYANLLQLFEEVSSEKFPISTSKWIVLYRKTEEVTRAAKVWYCAMPLIIMLLTSAAEENTKKVNSFMGVLDGWASNETSVSSETFLKRFDRIFGEPVGLQMDLNIISTIKIRHLHRISSDALAGTLDEENMNFIYRASTYVIHNLVLKPSEWWLRICRGRWLKFEKLTEVKNACKEMYSWLGDNLP